MKAVRATRGVVFRKSDAGQRLALARNKYILSRAIKPPFLFAVMAVAKTSETAEKRRLLVLRDQAEKSLFQL